MLYLELGACHKKQEIFDIYTFGFLNHPEIWVNCWVNYKRKNRRKFSGRKYFNYKLVTDISGGLYSVLFLKSLSCFSNTLLYLLLAHSTAKQGYIKHAAKTKQVKNNTTITIEIICIVSILYFNVL